jgi:predicted DNA binding CopG/RHH family protein
MEKEMKNLKIPETDSIEELASFWDTHDLTDFEELLEEVTEPVFERSIETISIPLFPQEIDAVKTIAKSQGTSYTDLVRSWVLEKLHTL